MESLEILLLKESRLFLFTTFGGREGVPNSHGTWERGIQVVVTSEMRDKVRQGLLLSSDYLKE